MSALEERLQLARESLFGRRARHPYYIVAPPYAESSAGIRALYVLCHALNAVGEEAYVVAPAAREGLHVAMDLRAPRLDAARAALHHAWGRTPTVVYPETFEIRPADAVRAVFVLNYLGHLGGPANFPAADLLFAFSANIARRTPGCDLIMHIPVIDAQYWTPDPTVARSGPPAVYAGKYVDHHHQALPARLEDATMITRNREDSPDRAELRAIFRSASHLYVFENTAAATEAALCGCPVVSCLNPFFDELISAEELGLAGFVFEDSPEALTQARRTVGAFRDDYLRAADPFAEALLDFVGRTQKLARNRIYDRPFPLGSA